jgi:predicted ATP-grasp superfamily ATP-dependent carboligase
MRTKPPGPPVIVLGGTANALSIARSLGSRGVAVYVLNDHDAHVRHSRYARWLPAPWLGNDETTWETYLLGPQAESLNGAVLLAACDAGIAVIARHRDALARRFVLDESNPVAQLAMLNKLETYRLARAAGVPTPRFWVLAPSQSLHDVSGELIYPLLIKPVYSHHFAERFGKKFFVAHDFVEASKACQQVAAASMEVVLLEMVPGPDDRLCSYYTYLDCDGKPHFHFTKRIIRRWPVNMGEACYHITDWNPEVAALALRLFQHAGLRGLANAEFKRDERDGQLKLIECNARFTAANGLVARSGLDLAWFVYCRLTGRPELLPQQYRTGLRLWYPLRDFRAFLELRRRGELTLRGWLRSIAHRQTFPYFRLDDPLPVIMRFLRSLKVDFLWHRTSQFLAGVRRCLRGENVWTANG